ncbi:SusD family protein [Chitinophaga costaii]|uniref:SusD family protein n=1 Tax=Chitinophaga costaii TaxID=1335309 RepID=A0A1C4FL04_9BACT|nr:RagB/SusD family nutrient uptake outer membrane protein [Chitinophaga costaii]PUZ29981.1 RagB/SusD family nutrient uptake outer membrane protein [Chitinophaga costaii]SCC56572.1 SusD family protein [Chitinophaga costaii]
MKRFTLLLCSFIVAFTVGGCKKWLDVGSKTDVVQTDMFSNEQGFMDAMSGVYYTMAGNALYGDKLSMSFLDVLAHCYDIKSSKYTNYEYNLDYGSNTYYLDATPQAIIKNVWDTMYYAIANDNNILANIDAQQAVFNDNNYKLMKGEALGLRAFMHFDLLRMFGPSYLTEPHTKSIPYVTKFSGKIVTPLYTVAAVTDSVIKDLLQAEQLLQDDDLQTQSVDNSWINNRKCHFNKLAVEATLARVYLYRGDKDQALQHALNVINSGRLRFVTATEMQISQQGAKADYSYSVEQIFSLYKDNIQDMVLHHFSFSGFNNSVPSQLTNQHAPDDNGGYVELLYETSSGGATDIRYLYGWSPYYTSGSAYWYISKYTQTYAKEQKLVPLIRLPEMYYIAAECSTDPVAALGYLNTVRTARAIKALPDGLTAADFQQEIFKEYQKEFIAEGQLFYYYKRRNESYIVDNNQTAQLPTSRAMYVFPLPADEISVGGR